MPGEAPNRAAKAPNFYGLRHGLRMPKNLLQAAPLLAFNPPPSPPINKQAPRGALVCFLTTIYWFAVELDADTPAHCCLSDAENWNLSTVKTVNIGTDQCSQSQVCVRTMGSSASNGFFDYRISAVLFPNRAQAHTPPASTPLCWRTPPTSDHCGSSSQYADHPSQMPRPCQAL